MHVPIFRKKVIIKYVTVDTLFAGIVGGFTWHADKDGYAVFSRRVNKKKVVFPLHRLLLNMPGKDVQVDHISGNITDNRLVNLRPASKLENRRNSKVNKRNRLGLKGVELITATKSPSYRVRVRCGSKLHSLGTFSCPQEAARAYDRKAKELFGEFARLNFPEGGT